MRLDSWKHSPDQITQKSSLEGPQGHLAVLSLESRLRNLKIISCPYLLLPDCSKPQMGVSGSPLSPGTTPIALAVMDYLPFLRKGDWDAGQPKEQQRSRVTACRLQSHRSESTVSFHSFYSQKVLTLSSLCSWSSASMRIHSKLLVLDSQWKSVLKASLTSTLNSFVFLNECSNPSLLYYVINMTSYVRGTCTVQVVSFSAKF